MRESTVFLIPSDDLGWNALRNSLQEQHVRIIGEATSAQGAIAIIAALQPDVIMSAATVDDEPVRHLLTKLRHTCCPTTRFIVFTTDLDREDTLPFAEIGIAGCLLWGDLSCATLPACLVMVLQSNVLVASPAVAQAFLEMQQLSQGEEDELLAQSRQHNTPNLITRQQRKVLVGVL